jgi:transcriptional regulator with XRE-family HTH domain
MNTQQIIDFFGGTQEKVAQEMGVGQSDIAKWLKRGSPPYLRQLQAQVISKGGLKADPAPPRKNSRAA